MKILFNKVKKETFIFTDTEIKNKINNIEYNPNINMCIHIMHELYNDKQNLTKEEYTKDVKEYLYSNSINSKEYINNILEKEKSWFYDEYDAAIRGELSFYEAVQSCRNQLMNFFKYKLVEPSVNDVEFEYE